jgi:hypothetical protein
LDEPVYGASSQRWEKQTKEEQLAVAGIRNKAEQLSAYARVRDLEKVETAGPSTVKIPSDGKPKAQQLAAAGKTYSAGNRLSLEAGTSLIG